MSDTPILQRTDEGLTLLCGERRLCGDFTRMTARLKKNCLAGELLVRAAKIKDADHPLTAVDATAGLGEDSLLLAAAGFSVTLCERNPTIFALLEDAVRRAAEIPSLAEALSRMHLHHGDSIAYLASLDTPPDVILLDPMFPERQKSALVKNKLQMIQMLEEPCEDERTLLLAAVDAHPTKLVIKRPPKGPHLAGVKPDYSIAGKAVRFDCFTTPHERRSRFLPLTP